MRVVRSTIRTGAKSGNQESVVKNQKIRCRSARCARSCALFAIAFAGVMQGCEVDSFMDPSRTGRFMHTPTTIPVLERFDVVEREYDQWGQVTGVLPEDLIPNDLTYVLSPGDIITVEVFELTAAGQWRPFSRQIDASGRFRLPIVGDLQAAGKTPQEFEDHIIEELREIIADPQVNVVVEQGAAFTFTIYGYIGAPNVYPIRRSDLRLLDAIALVGGAPQNTEKVYVIRQVPLTEDIRPSYERNQIPPTNSGQRPSDREAPVDVEDLIDQLENEPNPSPGAFQNTSGSMVDVDDLEPVRVSDQPPVDLEEIRQNRQDVPLPPQESYIFDEERGEWVRTSTDEPRTEDNGVSSTDAERRRLTLERVIEIPYDRLIHGDSTYNIVVRPDDRIYVQGPDIGFVYIDGEIQRPGVYALPTSGRLTLSRLVAAAGGLGGLAIPERVDVTRLIGPAREATVRLDLAAIRRRTEPDVFLKADDHVIIGTSFLATPLAVIRNGFRVTYGFGFLLDRNFGNDVFGAPPTNRLGE